MIIQKFETICDRIRILTVKITACDSEFWSRDSSRLSMYMKEPTMTKTKSYPELTTWELAKEIHSKGATPTRTRTKSVIARSELPDHAKGLHDSPDTRRTRTRSVIVEPEFPPELEPPPRKKNVVKEIPLGVLTSAYLTPSERRRHEGVPGQKYECERERRKIWMWLPKPVANIKPVSFQKLSLRCIAGSTGNLLTWFNASFISCSVTMVSSLVIVRAGLSCTWNYFLVSTV